MLVSAVRVVPIPINLASAIKITSHKIFIGDSDHTAAGGCDAAKMHIRHFVGDTVQSMAMLQVFLSYCLRLAAETAISLYSLMVIALSLA